MLVNPFTEFTKTGKNATNADMTIFDDIPFPNQSTSKGAKTKTGVACNAIA